MDVSYPVTRDGRVRLFLVEEHEAFCRSLTRYLQAVPFVQPVGLAYPDSGLFSAVLRAQPDVVLLDLGLHALDPRAVIQRLRALVPGVRIVILSLEYDEDTERRAVAAGADAFVAMERTLEDLFDTLQAMAEPT